MLKRNLMLLGEDACDVWINGPYVAAWRKSSFLLHHGELCTLCKVGGSVRSGKLHRCAPGTYIMFRPHISHVVPRQEHAEHAAATKGQANCPKTTHQPIRRKCSRRTATCSGWCCRALRWV